MRDARAAVRDARAAVGDARAAVRDARAVVKDARAAVRSRAGVREKRSSGMGEVESRGVSGTCGVQRGMSR